MAEDAAEEDGAEAAAAMAADVASEEATALVVVVAEASVAAEALVAEAASEAVEDQAVGILLTLLDRLTHSWYRLRWLQQRSPSRWLLLCTARPFPLGSKGAVPRYWNWLGHCSTT